MCGKVLCSSSGESGIREPRGSLGFLGFSGTGNRNGGQRQVVNALISHLCKFHVHFKLLNVFSSLFFVAPPLVASSSSSLLFFFSLFGLFHRRAFVGQAKTKLLLLLSETEVAGGEMGDLRGMG